MEYSILKKQQTPGQAKFTKQRRKIATLKEEQSFALSKNRGNDHVWLRSTGQKLHSTSAKRHLENREMVEETKKLRAI